VDDAIRAITFDARGTLLKVRFPVGETYAAVAARHGAEISIETVDAAFHEVFPTMPPLAFPPMREEDLHGREHDWWRLLVSRVMEAAGERIDFEPFFEELYAIYRGAEAWKPYREAASVLCLLRSNRYKIGLISNMDSRIEDILVALNLSIWFDSVVFSSRTGVAKPHPGIYQRAMVELDVEPHEMLHVGDSYQRDWQGARDAGAHALLLDREGYWADRVPADVPRVRSLEEVLDYLGVGGFAAFARAHAQAS
jgi:putative hydrolase of the HAD superfamily